MTGHDVVIVSVGISAVIGAAYAIHRAVRSFRTWVENLVVVAKHQFSEAVDSSATGHLVKYHLGPNGTTVPMHLRVKETHDVELLHHGQNSVKLDAMIARLEKVEQAQRAAASTAITVAADVEAARSERDDNESTNPKGNL